MTSLSDKEITKKTTIPIWLSLKTTVPIVFLIPLVICVGMLSAIAIISGKNTAEKFKKQSMTAVNNQIKERLKNYLEEPNLINQINTDAIREGQLNLQNINILEKYFWRQAKLFKNVNGIQFGTEDVRLRGIVREEKNKLSFNVVDTSTKSENVVFKADDKGNRGEIRKPQNTEKYDPRERDWYKAALGKNKSTWTKVFAKKTSSKIQLRLSAVQPVYDKKSNKLLGVLAVDFFLNQIADFLKELSCIPSTNKISTNKTGRTIFIVERSGKLIATSSASKEKPLFMRKGNDIKRVTASDSRDLLIRDAAKKVRKKYSNWENIEPEQLLDFSYKGETQIVKITPFDEYNLNWFVVLVVAEKEFMQSVQQTINTTIILGIGIFIFSILLVLLVTNWLIKPILRLNNAAKQIEDDSIPFEPEKIEPIAQRSDEIGELAGMFKEMALQIFAREQSLNSKVEELRQESDQAKKAALASQLSGNVDVHTLLLRSQQARQKIGD